jgi:hypothetical protein
LTINMLKLAFCPETFSTSRVTLSLDVENVSGQDMYLAFFNDMNDNTTLNGDDGVSTSYVSISGIPVVSRHEYNNVKYYLLLPGGKRTVVNLTAAFRKEKSDADIYHLTSGMAVYNKDEPDKPIIFAAGISNIRLK